MKTGLSGDVSKRLALGSGAETAHELEVEIEQIRARLAANEAERKELEGALRDLVSRSSAATAIGQGCRRNRRRCGDARPYSGRPHARRR